MAGGRRCISRLSIAPTLGIQPLGLCRAAKLSINHETLRQWVRRAEVDAGQRPGLTTDERARIKELERENRELRRANEILKAAAAFLRGGARPPVAALIEFIDAHRERFGVEPICRVLTEHGCRIAPNTYWVANKREPSKRAVRNESCRARSGGSMTRTCSSTAPTRSGPSSTTRASGSPAAPSSG